MKKFISMALALVMTLSLCTFVTAPKADAAFDDTGELAQYSQQAIDVIQTIQVMDGTSEGQFSPAAGLTRQAAAKIICNMILGPATAKALPTNDNPFPDVAAGSTFSGYISYCKQQGIISGYSDGNFQGDKALSGYAYMKMLLGALGYTSEAEGFTGSNWKVNVAKLALGIGLNKGVPDDKEGEQLEGQITREAAAIYAFNTLQADMVEYEGKNTLEINGVKVTMGGANAIPQTWNTSSTSNDYINNRKSDGLNQRPIVQFAERYFDKLRREPNAWDVYTQDDFGRPSIRWFWKGVEIGTYSREPDATFVGGVKVNKIYEELGMNSGDDEANLYINSSIPNNERLNVARSNDKDLDDASNLLMNAQGNSSDVYGDGNHRVDRIGDGTIIECYRNDANNHVDVCVISVYGGKVSAVRGATTKKDAYVTIDYGMGATANNGADHLDKHPRRPDTITASGNNEFETEDFDEDDVVAYTYSDSAQSIKSMYLMDSEVGTLTSRIVGKSLTLDGELYAYGKEYTFDDISDYESGLSNRSSYVVYFDENDYVLWVEEDEFAVDQYVLIERISIETTSATDHKTITASVIASMETATDLKESDNYNSTAMQTIYQQSKTALGTGTWDARARLRFSNGTVRTVTLDDSKNYRTDSGDDRANYRYAYNSDGTVAYSTDANGNITTRLSSGSGDGKGNWIAEKFTAGHIVRCSSNNGVYKLHAVPDLQSFVAYNFGLNDRMLGTKRYVSSTSNPERVAYNLNTGLQTQYVRGSTTQREVVADSDTHFAIDDVVNGSWKSYTGIKNAPDVSKTAYNTAAYIYHRNGVAKLIFVTNATVTSSSDDIVFIAANSASNKITGTDIDDYYTVTAVEKNEVKTIMIKADLADALTGNSIAYRPGTGIDDEQHCVILNNVNYDSNDLMTSGEWNSDDAQALRAQGIRRVNNEEVRVDTYRSNSIIRDLAENVKIFFVDGDDIEQIEVDEIVNDTMDMVYYVFEDGEITYLFIVDYDQEAEETGDASRLWADGELELLDPNGEQVRYIYHYMGSNGGNSQILNALRSRLNKASNGSIVNNDGVYTATIDGVEYTLTRQQDAHAVVTGTVTPTNASWSASMTPFTVYTYDENGNRVITSAFGTDDNGNTVVTGKYLADSSVTLTITPVSPNYNITVSLNGTAQTIHAVEGSTAGTQTVTFTVPKTDFTLNIVATAPAS